MTGYDLTNIDFLLCRSHHGEDLKNVYTKYIDQLKCCLDVLDIYKSNIHLNKYTSYSEIIMFITLLGTFIIKERTNGVFTNKLIKINRGLK